MELRALASSSRTLRPAGLRGGLCKGLRELAAARLVWCRQGLPATAVVRVCRRHCSACGRCLSCQAVRLSLAVCHVTDTACAPSPGIMHPRTTATEHPAACPPT